MRKRRIMIIYSCEWVLKKIEYSRPILLLSGLSSSLTSRLDDDDTIEMNRNPINAMKTKHN